jgi:Protein of unknown function (DUF3634)
MYKIIIQIKLFFLQIAAAPKLIIEIDNGIPKKISGNVKSVFLVDCLEICARNKIKYALIYVVKGNFDTPVLKASSEISKSVLQQLRNTWGFNF